MKTLAETFLEAVTAAYPGDPSAPGIVVSFLGKQRGYYVSLVRYSKPLGSGKHIALKVVRATLDAALTECAERWFATECAERWFAEHAPAETAVRALKKALKERGVMIRPGERGGWDQPDSEYFADQAEEATWWD